MARPVRLDNSEEAFENKVLSAAVSYGWRVHAERKSRVTFDRFGNKRTDTPIKGHRGYPDVTMVHRRHGIILAELKTEKGKLGEGQPEWIGDLALHDAPGSPVLVELWRPADWDAIVVALRDGLEAYRARYRGPRKPGL